MYLLFNLYIDFLSFIIVFCKQPCIAIGNYSYLSILIVGGGFGQFDVGDIDSFSQVTRRFGGQSVGAFVADVVFYDFDGCL